MNRLAAHRFRVHRAPVLAGLLAFGLMTGAAAPVLGSGTFSKTGTMNVARISHSATLLSNGEVLVAGGENSSLAGTPLSSAELYNPATGSWTLTGSMNTAREGHQAVLLASGEVLIAGGTNASGTLASAELYDASTGTWAATGSMNTARSGFSLTLLQNGKALAVQGTSAELYDPSAGAWTTTGSPPNAVGGPNALLQDGQVLAIGETINTPSAVYDPSTDTWSATGSTGSTILDTITARLLSGEVLTTGGFVSGNRAYSTAAQYDPSTGQFTLENGPCQCSGFSGTVLQTGEVLAAGGIIVVPGNPYPSYQTIKSAELWDPSTQAWKSTGNLNGSRSGESVTLLQNGQALIAGGSQSTKNPSTFVVLATAELYKP